ncbi:AMP phosphorylase [Candidatus Woesearchaeota archaeon CG08_land_8_20_14_0_20_47_9]|nr:MAG: AMP phosphorylase [Candidatus Woesearchaeota archaeon CG10_big_fil_rev_8_21_14_0_10_47_5]PIO03153.1 MAG: AMP phosphorylase [Candidatus Woesearchaeota archaeon CG08_land_8_20_14_0_20_47_9]HII29966.1 AMP phosphorylase [Candidatus Woesearchaeota archaeon]
MLKIRVMGVTTGGPLIILLSRRDAEKRDLHFGDRILIRRSRKRITAIVDIVHSKLLPTGYIGMFDEPLKKLGGREGDLVEVSPESKPASIGYIKKKLDGKRLNEKEISTIVADISEDRLSETEASCFVSACYCNRLSMNEIVWLTRAMVESGEVLRINRTPIVDLHCVGGVPGNRTTMIVVPIIAAAGLTVPKTSSRAITSPAGTADTMEVLAPVDVSMRKLEAVVKRTGGCITWGGAINLAPADDKIIRVEHSLNIDAEGQMLASVMAKKHSVRASHLLLDIPIGPNSKVCSRKAGLHLKRQFEEVARRLGMRIRVVFSDGSQPIGNGIGAALEARDSLMVLQNSGDAPPDLREKSLMLAGQILEFVGHAKHGKGALLAREILESGRAYRKLVQIIKAQGGRTFTYKRVKLGSFKRGISAARSGRVKAINNQTMTRIAKAAGAPRDAEAGLYLFRHVNSKVNKGETLYSIYANSSDKLRFATRIARTDSGFVIS